MCSLLHLSLHPLIPYLQFISRVIVLENCVLQMLMSVNFTALNVALKSFFLKVLFLTYLLSMFKHYFAANVTKRCHMKSTRVYFKCQDTESNQLHL